MIYTRYIAEKIRSRKGMALEMAIIFMIVAFALCALLVTTSIAIHQQNKLTQNFKNEKAELDDIGETFIQSVRDGVGAFPTALQADKEWIKSNKYKFFYTEPESANEDATLHQIVVCDMATERVKLTVLVQRKSITSKSIECTVMKWSTEVTDN